MQSRWRHAQVGVKAAAVQTQIDSFLATGTSFGDKDLVTVLAGQHDILAQYELVRTSSISLDEAKQTLAAAGLALAAQVNRVANLGGKVLISTAPDIGYSPFAGPQAESRAIQLHALTKSFNEQLVIGLINDGHKIGLVTIDDTMRSMVRNTALNSTDRACSIDVPACTTLTLNTTTTTMPTPPTSTTVTNWLWADDTHLGVAGHVALGNAAVSRAKGNPF
jgi:outer membrane lipase/esterase